MTGRGEPGDEGTGVTIDVLRGAPNADELAALMAVVSESYAVEAATALADEVPTRSAWEVSARAMRTPLRRDLGWGQFAG